MSDMIPNHKRRWITKHMAHVSATGKTMGPRRRKKRDTELCPMCDEVEDTDHIIRCRCQLTKDTFQKHLETLDTWLSKHSPDDLRQAIIEIISAVRERRNPMIHQSWSQAVQDVAFRQYEVSSRALVHGLFLREWMDIQAEHRLRTQARMTELSWNAHVIRLIWDISWEIWRKRCDFLHSTEDARQKILAANIDNDITNLVQSMPPNTHMTQPQRSLLTSNSLATILSWPAKRKIRWFRKAQIMKESFELHLHNLQRHPSAQLFRRFVRQGINNQPPQPQPPADAAINNNAPINNPTRTPSTQSTLTRPRQRRRTRTNRQRRRPNRPQTIRTRSSNNLPSLTHLKDTKQTTLPFLLPHTPQPQHPTLTLSNSSSTDSSDSHAHSRTTRQITITEWQQGRIRTTRST